MNKSEMFTPEEISIIQTRQLRKTIHYIYERSPYYRDLMDREGMTPADIKALADLRHLPLTSKEDFLREGDRFLCVRPEEIVDIMTTSGTVGEPAFYKATSQDLARLAYNEQLSFRAAGLTHKDVVALAVSLDRGSLPGMAFYLGLRQIGATALRLGPIAPAFFLRFLEQTSATAILAMPSFLKRVAVYAEETGHALRHCGVRKLICVGEPVRRIDYTLNPLGQMLARAWDAQVIASYTSTELATSFCECEEGCGGHLHPELACIEILNDKGYPVEEGEVGELCATPFGVTGMPLLRYRTGDFTFLRTEVCACGRQTLRLGPVLGRRGQMLKVQGTFVFPTSIHEIVQADPDVRAHVLVVENEDAMSDKLTLLLETSKPRAVERIREHVWLDVKIAPEIKTVSAEDMQALQGEGEFRRRRIFIDRRQPAL